jgi:hypothetical protein
MNSGENVHGENSIAQRSPLVGDVGPSSTSPQCQPTTDRKENNLDPSNVLFTIVLPGTQVRITGRNHSSILICGKHCAVCVGAARSNADYSPRLTTHHKPTSQYLSRDRGVPTTSGLATNREQARRTSTMIGKASAAALAVAIIDLHRTPTGG